MTKLFLPAIIIMTVILSLHCSGKIPVHDPDIVAYWKFDELTQNGEMTPDASGNGHHGRVHGQQLVDGIIGGAMKFEGLDQIVEVGDFELSASATIVFWIKTHDLFRDRRLFSQIEGTEGQAGALRLDGVQVEVWDGSEWQVLIDRHMKINEWMHIAVVYEENGKTSGYLNGSRQHLVRSGFEFSGVKAAIGAKFMKETGNVYTGCMDDFRVYSKALSGDEIKAIYTGATQ